MRSSNVLILASAFMASVLAAPSLQGRQTNLGLYPACAQTCVKNANNFGCSANDPACQCHSTPYLAGLEACFQSECENDPISADDALGVLESVCIESGDGLSAFPTLSGGLPTTSEGAATSTSEAATTSTGSATSTAPTTTTAPSSSSPAGSSAAPTTTSKKSAAAQFKVVSSPLVAFVGAAILGGLAL